MRPLMALYGSYVKIWVINWLHVNMIAVPVSVCILLDTCIVYLKKLSQVLDILKKLFLNFKMSSQPQDAQSFELSWNKANTRASGMS